LTGTVNWESSYSIALIPPGAAIIVSLLVVIFGGSPNAGQWAAIITFFVTLPFVVGRLIDRAK
jgi:uncharacterized protein YybS (DUF2232 family)